MALKSDNSITIKSYRNEKVLTNCGGCPVGFQRR